VSAVREARADAVRRLLVRNGGEFLLDREGFATLGRLGFRRVDATRALDDLGAAGVVEFADDRPFLVARLRTEAA